MSIYGRLIGIGLGPGDPELMSLKAARLLKETMVVAYFAKAGRMGHARRIVEGFLPDHSLEVPLYYPLTVEKPFEHPDYIAALADFYTKSAEQLAELLKLGRDVALLCEGDPLLYGSFMHLYVRLRAHFAVEIVPGIPAMAGCWSAAGLPMAWGDDVLTILPATLPAPALAVRLASSEAAVIMKIGRNFAKVRAAINAAGRMNQAVYVEYGSMPQQKVMLLAEKEDEQAPYFAMVLIPGEGRRP